MSIAVLAQRTAERVCVRSRALGPHRSDAGAIRSFVAEPRAGPATAWLCTSCTVLYVVCVWPWYVTLHRAKGSHVVTFLYMELPLERCAVCTVSGARTVAEPRSFGKRLDPGCAIGVREVLYPVYTVGTSTSSSGGPIVLLLFSANQVVSIAATTTVAAVGWDPRF